MSFDLEAMRASYEGWLAKHRAALDDAPPERAIHARAAVANDCRQLAAIALAADDANARARLLDAARAHLAMVELRGRSPVEPAPAIGYSTGSALASYRASLHALAAGDVELARAIAPYLWDPPGARYVRSAATQAIAYALREHLRDGDVAAQLARARSEDVAGELADTCCLPALGLGALAVREGLIDQLPSDAFLPRGVVG